MYNNVEIHFINYNIYKLSRKTLSILTLKEYIDIN